MHRSMSIKHKDHSAHMSHTISTHILYDTKCTSVYFSQFLELTVALMLCLEKGYVGADEEPEAKQKIKLERGKASLQSSTVVM